MLRWTYHCGAASHQVSVHHTLTLVLPNSIGASTAASDQQRGGTLLEAYHLLAVQILFGACNRDEELNRADGSAQAADLLSCPVSTVHKEVCLRQRLPAIRRTRGVRRGEDRTQSTIDIRTGIRNTTVACRDQ